MFRSFLALGVIANGILFASGIWRSVLRGEQAFHNLGDLITVSGWLGQVWLWPLTLILVCALVVVTNRRSKNKPFDR